MKILFALLLSFVLSSAFAKSVLDIDAEFDELYQLAQEKSGKDPLIFSFIELVQQRAETKTSNFKGLGQVVNYLSDSFSFYARATQEALPVYCTAYGIDVGAYLKAFDRENKAVDGRVSRAYVILGTDYDATWDHLKPFAMKNGDWLLRDLSLGLGVPKEEVCATLKAQPEATSKQLAYEKIYGSRSDILKFLSP